MKRRFLILSLLFVAFVGIVLGVMAMLPPSPGVTKANYDRVQFGMTLKEVESIFGKPGTRFESHIALVYCWSSIDLDGNDDSLKLASFTFVDETVARKSWQGPDTVFDKLRHWLHLD